jgi:hypothetical protein
MRDFLSFFSFLLRLAGEAGTSMWKTTDVHVKGEVRGIDSVRVWAVYIPPIAKRAMDGAPDGLGAAQRETGKSLALRKARVRQKPVK